MNSNVFPFTLYKCSACIYRTFSLPQLTDHHDKIHLKKDNGFFQCEQVTLEPYKCKDCTYKAELKVVLYEHVKTKHQANKSDWCSEYNLRTYNCTGCSLETHSVLVFLGHDHKLEEKRTQIVDENTHSEDIHWFKCEQCPYQSKFEAYLALHVKKRHNEQDTIKWYKCGQCTFQTKWEKLLSRHVQWRHGTLENVKWYQCEQCSFKTNQERHLSDHVSVAHNSDNIDSESVEHLMTANPNFDLVDFLTKNRFIQLSHDDRVFIAKLAVPRPSMESLVQHLAGRNRAFNISWYEKCEWLTGSEVTNRLFCWHCLLFNQNKRTSWTTTGYANLKDFSRGLQKHQSSREHIHSSIKFKLFLSQHVSKTEENTESESIEKHNQAVRQNRIMLKHLINMVLYFATQESRFRSKEGNKQSINQDSFRELTRFAATLDENFKLYLSNLSVFNGLSQNIQNDLIGSINKILENKIFEEIKQAKCFSWEIVEATDISCFSQISVIFKYVYEGKVVERFVGFYDVSKSRKADDLFKFLVGRFNHLDIETKLVGQTVDGAAVMTEELSALKTKIQSVAPQANFIHCHAHKINLVLQDSSKIIRECRIFFSNVRAFSSFFTQSRKRIDALNSISRKNDCETGWNFKSQIIHTLFKEKDILMKLFNNILENYTEWDDVTIREVQVLKNHLSDFNFLFLVNTFHLIFTQTDSVFSTVENMLLNLNAWNENIEGLLTTFKQYDDIVVKNLINDTKNSLQFCYGSTKKRKIEIKPDVEDRMKKLFYEILDVAINQIKIRFGKLSVFTFVELLDHSKFLKFAKYFPRHLIHSLKGNYPHLFDEDKLRKELEVLYLDRYIFGTSTKLTDVLLFMFDNNLYDDVPELYKLLCLIVSLPASSTSDERNFSALKRIKTYTRNTLGQNQLNNLSLIAVEKDLIKRLAEDDKFYESIIDHFAQSKIRNIELFYKNV